MKRKGRGTFCYNTIWHFIIFSFQPVNGLKLSHSSTLIQYLFKCPINTSNKVSFPTFCHGNSVEGKSYLLCSIKTRWSMRGKLWKQITPHFWTCFLQLSAHAVVVPTYRPHRRKIAICNAPLNTKARLPSDGYKRSKCPRIPTVVACHVSLSWLMNTGKTNNVSRLN